MLIFAIFFLMIIIIISGVFFMKNSFAKEKFEKGIEIGSKTKNTKYMDYLLYVRNKIEKGEEFETKLKRDDKIIKLNNVCNWTKPEMFMIETSRLPVYWKMKTYDGHSLPYELNNYCEKNIRNCI
jgi:hypothetical protein